MLGMFEAGLYPGVGYLLSWFVKLSSIAASLFRPSAFIHHIPEQITIPYFNFLLALVFTYFRSWYKRSELGLRAAFFTSATTVSGAFGGLLAVRAIFIFIL